MAAGPDYTRLYIHMANLLEYKVHKGTFQCTVFFYCIKSQISDILADAGSHSVSSHLLHRSHALLTRTRSRSSFRRPVERNRERAGGLD